MSRSLQPSDPGSEKRDVELLPFLEKLIKGLIQFISGLDIMKKDNNLKLQFESQLKDITGWYSWFKTYVVPEIDRLGIQKMTENFLIQNKISLDRVQIADIKRMEEYMIAFYHVITQKEPEYKR